MNSADFPRSNKLVVSEVYAYANKNEIIESLGYYETIRFCSYRSFIILPKEQITGKRTFIKIVMAMIKKTTIEHVTEEVIEDEFMNIKRHLIKLGLNKKACIVGLILKKRKNIGLVELVYQF